MFSMMHEEDEGEPTPADEGRFLSEEELHDWHRGMQAKHPTVFTADDLLFGEQGHQHALGTKLMAYFDDDPSKPMRVEVRGSKWQVEFGDRTPMYVIRFKGQQELSLIALTSAHEDAGWRVGWDLPPPAGN